MTRPALTLITIAVETARLEAFRASAAAAGLPWLGDETEVSDAAHFGIGETMRLNEGMAEDVHS